MPAARQPDLFGDTPDPAVAGGELLRVSGGSAPLSKAQKEFNRLTRLVAELRAHVVAWQAASDALQQRHAAELAPQLRRLRDTQREAVLWIDAFLQHPPAGEKLTRKARAKLDAMLRLLACDVLDQGPDAEVEAAHDRYSAQHYADVQQDETDLTAAALGKAFGDDTLFEGPAASLDELLQRAAERMAQAPEPEPPHSRAAKARARDEKALKDASQSVRNVYRRLARELHPDREPDAAQRERKTALVARANQAYEANDLLTLLTLQLDLEQIDGAGIAALPDQRLRHYNRVLKEQQATLEGELAMLQMPASAAMQDAPPGLLRWAPQLLDLAFARDLQAVRSAQKSLAADLDLLRDARTRPLFLQQVQVEDPDHGMSDAEHLLLETMLAGMSAPPRRRRR